MHTGKVTEENCRYLVKSGVYKDKHVMEAGDKPDSVANFEEVAINLVGKLAVQNVP